MWKGSNKRSKKWSSYCVKTNWWKGAIVFLDLEDYNREMHRLLSDEDKYEKWRGNPKNKYKLELSNIFDCAKGEYWMRKNANIYIWLTTKSLWYITFQKCIRLKIIPWMSYSVGYPFINQDCLNILIVFYKSMWWKWIHIYRHFIDILKLMF